MSDVMEFDQIFKKTSTGKIEHWRAVVLRDDTGRVTITTTHGLVGKKETDKITEVTEGKNIGKANETSPFEQACKEAQSKWEKKIKKGYVNSQEEAEQGEEKILPMLAHSYEKRKKNIIWPALAQPKIDGHRAYGTAGSLLSRGGDPVPGLVNMPHVQEDIRRLSASLPEGTWYDGELYSTDIPFEKLSGCIRREKLKEEAKPLLAQVKYHIFDLFNPGQPDWPCNERLSLLRNTLEVPPDFNYLVCVETTRIISNEELLMIFQQECIKNGYEGAIVRNLAGAYKIGHRSADLQKVKTFQDDEFEIVNHEVAMDHYLHSCAACRSVSPVFALPGCDGNHEAGTMATVVWACVTKNGHGFQVRPKGTVEQRAQWLKDAHQYHGKMLTVTYQELTEDGIPRFPVGKAIREPGS